MARCGKAITKTSTGRQKMRRYPIDYDKLQKGDRISTSELADILQVEPDTAEFSLRALALTTKIENELYRRGKDCVVVFRQQCILVLTDAESINYINTTARTGVRKICKAYDSLSKVDMVALNEDDRIRFSRSVVVTSALYQGVTQSAKTIPPEPQKSRLGLPVITPRKKVIM